ncbi:MAG: hypothetical protein ACKO96_42590 [Flammeovirgaceae bacterium]
MRAAIVFMLLLGGCDYYDQRLEIVNKVGSEVAVETYLDTSPDFPSVNKTEFYLSHSVAPNDSVTLTRVGKNGWPFLIQRSKNKKLNLVIYSIDSLRKYQSIDTLIKKGIYKKSEFSEDELEKMGWSVTLR